MPYLLKILILSGIHSKLHMILYCLQKGLSLSVVYPLVSEPLLVLLQATNFLAVVVGDRVGEAVVTGVHAVFLNVLEELLFSLCGC